jgi:TonB family protein
MTVQSYQPQINLTAYETASRQRRLLRTLVALAVLAGFALLVVRYRDSLRSMLPGASNEARGSASYSAAETQSQVSPAKAHRITSAHHAVVASASDAQSGPDFTEATIRPPLLVEVISGTGQRQIIRTRDESIYLDWHNKTLVSPHVADANGVYGAGVVNASEQTQLSAGAIEPAVSQRAITDSLATKQQTMEGAVVLLARIDRNGNIENLQVLSGPENLSGAAREAVKHWRFKPYYKAGQAVETDAQITVKFAIAAQ